MEAIEYIDACEAQEQPLPRLVLLDLYLPNREQAWVFLQTIQSRSWQRTMSVVAISRSGEPADVNMAYDLGASSYIIKPMDLDGWFEYFNVLRTYWWHTATLPTR